MPVKISKEAQVEMMKEQRELMQNKNKPIIIICGKSGSGKNYVPEQIFGLRYCQGNTTRKKRDSDPKGLIYSTKKVYNQFKDKATLQDVFHGNLYWTWIEDFNDSMYDFVVASPEAIKSFLTKVEKQDAQAKSRSRDILRPYKLVYFETTLRKRIQNMRTRGDSLKDIFSRILHDRKVFANAKELILNNDGVIFIS